MNNEMNKAHTYGDFILSEEYDKRMERRVWMKKHKAKLLLSVAVATLVALAVAFWLYMI